MMQLFLKMSIELYSYNRIKSLILFVGDREHLDLK